MITAMRTRYCSRDDSFRRSLVFGRKSQQSMFERAVATFNRELRYSLHKVHLLCLVAHGLQLSRQCDCPVLQAVLLSMVPKELCSLETHQPNQKSLLKLVRWFSAESVTLWQAVEASCPEFCCSVVSQLLVALLMAVGLRARVVLVLDPVPFKGGGKKPHSRDSSIKTRSRSSSVVEIVDDLSNVVKVKSDGNVKLLEENVTKLEGKRGGSSEESVQSQAGKKSSRARKRGASPLPVDSQAPTSSKRRRTSRATNSSNLDQDPIPTDTSATGDIACSSKSARQRKGKGRGRRGSEPVSSALSCKRSPYFKKKGKSRKLGRGRRGDSESASDGFESSDEDFVPRTKLSRFTSSEEAGEVAQLGEGEGSCSDSSETETRDPKKGKSKRSKGKGSKGVAKKIKVAAAEGASTCGGSSPSKEEAGEQGKERAGGETKLQKGALYGENILDCYYGMHSWLLMLFSHIYVMYVCILLVLYTLPCFSFTLNHFPLIHIILHHPPLIISSPSLMQMAPLVGWRCTCSLNKSGCVCTAPPSPWLSPRCVRNTVQGEG